MLDRLLLNEVKLFGFHHFPPFPFLKNKQKTQLPHFSTSLYRPDRNILKKSGRQPVVYFMLNVTSIDFF